MWQRQRAPLSCTIGANSAMSGKPVYLIRAALFVTFFLIYGYSGYTLSRSSAFEYWNVLFNADVNKIIEHLTVPDGDHSAYTKNHPLFVLFFNPIGAAVVGFVGSNVVSAIIINAFVAAAAVPLFQMLLARNGVDNHTACYWALLLGFSASHVLFGSVPESFVFSATALILFCLTAPYATSRPWLLICIGLLCFGITITNLAIAGIIYLRYLAPADSFRRVVQGHFSPYLMSLARFLFSILAIGAVLSGLQKVFYPSSGVFLRPRVFGNMKYSYGLQYLLTLDARIFERIVDTVQGFFLYDLFAPKPSVPSVLEFVDLRHWLATAGVELTFKASSVKEYEWFTYVTILVWISLLASAALIYICSKSRAEATPYQGEALVDALVACLGFQFLLHFIYGNHAFLYSPHWTFMVVGATAILAQNTLGRRPLRVMLGILVVGLAINNAIFMNGVNDVLRCLLIDECAEFADSNAGQSAS